MEDVKAKVNRTVKDSVFRDLFSDKKYLLQLYRALHPEDAKASEQDLECVTLEQVLMRDIYNDLGFCVGDRLLIFVEAQSTWSVNIIVRCLMYLVHTYQGYLKQKKQSLFSNTPVSMPEPEFYVLYTGDEKITREEITLSEEFFGGKETALEVRVKVLTDGKPGDIISQYVLFTKVVDEQVKVYGRTGEAVTKAIQICKDKGVLYEYLEKRETEVVDIMLTLFDQQEALKDFIAAERREGREEGKRQGREEGKRQGREEGKRQGREEGKRETAKKLYERGMPMEDIGEIVGYPVRVIEEWLGLVVQSQQPFFKEK